MDKVLSLKDGDMAVSLFARKLYDFIHDNAEGLAMVSVIGTLECIKLQLVDEAF